MIDRRAEISSAVNSSNSSRLTGRIGVKSVASKLSAPRIFNAFGKAFAGSVTAIRSQKKSSGLRNCTLPKLTRPIFVRSDSFSAVMSFALIPCQTTSCDALTPSSRAKSRTLSGSTSNRFFAANSRTAESSTRASRPLTVSSSSRASPACKFKFDGTKSNVPAALV